MCLDSWLPSAQAQFCLRAPVLKCQDKKGALVGAKFTNLEQNLLWINLEQIPKKKYSAGLIWNKFPKSGLRLQEMWGGWAIIGS